MAVYQCRLCGVTRNTSSATRGHLIGYHKIHQAVGELLKELFRSVYLTGPRRTSDIGIDYMDGPILRLRGHNEEI